MKLKIKKLKYVLFLFVFLLDFCLLKGSGVKYISSDLELKAINPTTPKAGDLLTITFELNNIGNERGNFHIYFLNNTVFQFISENEEIINVGAKGTKDFNAYFKINDNALSGKYPLIVKVLSETGEEKTFNFFIEIKNDANLVLKQKNIVCLIGKECNLNLTLLNNGYGKAKNIVINFDLPSKTIEINELKPLDSKPLNVNIYVPENLEEGVYNLKALISYMDENNNLIKKEVNLPIELKSNVDLQISSLDYDKEENYIKVKVENPGEGKAKEIKVEVELPKLNLKRTFYLGSLNEGEDSTIYFYLPTILIKEREQPVLIKVYWKDYKEEEKKFEGNILIENNIKENTKIIWVVLFSILLVLVYFIIKKKKGKKEGKKE